MAVNKQALSVKAGKGAQGASKTKGNTTLGTATPGSNPWARFGRDISGIAGLAAQVGNAAANYVKANQSPSSPFGYIGGGGGYGGGSTGPTDEQKAAAKALGGTAAIQAKGIKDKFGNVKDAITAANNAANKTANLAKHAVGRTVAGEWYHNGWELPQKTANALRERMGTALSGSARLAFGEDFQRYVDDQAVEAIRNELQQKNDLEYERAQTVAKNDTELNKMAADIQSSLLQGATDFVTQLINMHPDLVKDKNLYGQLINMDVFKDAKKTKNLTTNQMAKAVSFPTALSSGVNDFYKKNKVAVTTPKFNAIIRPKDAIGGAMRKGLIAGSTDVASAANPEYLKRLNTHYGQRTY